ncbi:MAG: hypothetical protein ABFS86_04775 [Planctomycetota bacterium]
MRRTKICLILSLLLATTAGCQTTGEDPYRRDFELYVEGQELENVNLDPDIGGDIDVGADRDRLGARFAFGPDKVRGFFHVFKENWQYTDLPGGLRGAEYDNWGIGGGLKGEPVVKTFENDLKMLVPYRGDISFVWGEHEDDSEWEMRYVEIHLEAAFAIDWRGLRPAAGLAVSGIGGLLEGYGTDTGISGGNAGLFLDLSYQHPEFPLYGHIRAMGGDYRMLVIGFGAKF